MPKLTDYLDNLAEKAGKKIEEIEEKIEKKLDEVDDKLGEKLEDKIEGIKQTWENLGPDAKKDIKKGEAATGVGAIFGGIPAIAGLIYAAKKFKDAYGREQGSSRTSAFKMEEKLKLGKLGIEDYIKNIGKDRDVYGDVPEKELNELQKYAVEIKTAGFKKYELSKVETELSS